MSSANAVQIHQIGSIGEPRMFTLAEAQALLPLIQNITEQAAEELAPVKKRLDNMLATDPRTPGVQSEYEDVIKLWVSKLERLGVVVTGLWLVDFDTGDGYLCWKYPELRIAHYHGYDEGYAGRSPLAEAIEELDPDWA
ncbi:MAG: hypothetical protein MAG794_00007 [Gammaproteobacteria bacterium]|nr:hypothetical protein [Gammaproteobacteria bacterium]